MPAKGHQKSDPVDKRIRVQLTVAQAAQLARLADDARVSQSEYMRSLLDSANGAVVKVPKPKRQSGTMLQLVEIHELAMQVRKLGTNINQLARQANVGMVPLSRGEVEQMLSRHEELMLKAIAVIEKALPG
jgi:Bacterial mobilisation protein (MobC)